MHFHADARRFDAIYQEQKDPLTRFIDHVWRGVVRRRFQLTLEKLRPLNGRTVLDVGCGSGRYCIAFAQEGATRVLGVDFAPGMIDLAKDLSQRAGVAGQCEYRAGTFPDIVPDGPFDISTALGFFDYVADPERTVKAMRDRTRSTMIMSFPKSAEWRTPLRRLRFRIAGCPLFLYSEARVRDILARAGVPRYEWIPLDRDYIVVARL
jgi:2-polyprenyl-3-methyl-5-hydroxy-6-metoxy-1,4-benzoquinol methylase